MTSPVKIDIDPAFFDQLEADLTKVARQVVAEMATSQIVLTQRRVENGLGVLDTPMPAYSAAYARQKAKTGRSADERNLTYTGAMLRAIVLERIERSERGFVAVLGFATAEQAQIAKYNQERSAWFGVSPQDAITLNRIAQRRLEAAVNARNTTRQAGQPTSTGEI